MKSKGKKEKEIRSTNEKFRQRCVRPERAASSVRTFPSLRPTAVMQFQDTRAHEAKKIDVSSEEGDYGE